MRIGCILLAAGSGKRFGSNKLTHTVDGVSLAERACKLHAAIPYTARVMVSRPADAFLSALAKRYGFTLAENARAAQGIGTSAATGVDALCALEPTIDGALFAVCDQPFLTRETIEVLLAAFADAPDMIAAPFCCGKRGNPVLFPKSLLLEFDELDADIGGGAIIRKHPDMLLPVTMHDPVEFFDIDTKSDESRITHVDHIEG